MTEDCSICNFIGNTCPTCTVSTEQDNTSHNAELHEKELEAIAKESGKSRCLGCFYFRCRCASGHMGRL